MPALLKLPVCLIGLASVGLVAAGDSVPAENWREARPLMGTLVEIQAEGDDLSLLKRAAAAAYREMERLIAIMSHYEAGSVVSEINRHAGVLPVAAPPELIEVLRMAERVSETTAGAFDVTIGALNGWRFDTDDATPPAAAAIARQRSRVNYRDVLIDEARGTVSLRRRGMRLDLGGIAKLYILHAGMNVLQAHGIDSAMIDGGGDIEVIGAKRAQPWRIGIRHPRCRGELLGTVELREGFIVSSGDYERYFKRAGRRYHHVLDPQTGRPTQGVVHVTLVAPTLERINGYSAVAMVLGDARGRALIERRSGVEGLVVREDGMLWMSPGMERRFLGSEVDYCK